MNIFEKLASDINASVSEKLANVTEKQATTLSGVQNAMMNQLAIGRRGADKLMGAGMPLAQAQKFADPALASYKYNRLLNRMKDRAVGMGDQDMAGAASRMLEGNASRFEQAQSAAELRNPKGLLDMLLGRTPKNMMSDTMEGFASSYGAGSKLIPRTSGSDAMRSVQPELFRDARPLPKPRITVEPEDDVMSAIRTLFGK